MFRKGCLWCAGGRHLGLPDLAPLGHPVQPLEPCTVPLPQLHGIRCPIRRRHHLLPVYRTHGRGADPSDIHTEPGHRHCPETQARIATTVPARTTCTNEMGDLCMHRSRWLVNMTGPRNHHADLASSLCNLRQAISVYQRTRLHGKPLHWHLRLCAKTLECLLGGFPGRREASCRLFFLHSTKTRKTQVKSDMSRNLSALESEPTRYRNVSSLG